MANVVARLGGPTEAVAELAVSLALLCDERVPAQALVLRVGGAAQVVLCALGLAVAQRVAGVEQQRQVLAFREQRQSQLVLLLRGSQLGAVETRTADASMERQALGSHPALSDQ